MKNLTVVVLLGGLILSGCTTGQKGAAVGGLGGAALGGIIGKQTGGNAGTGAVIGGVVGTVGGMIIGDNMEKKFCPVCGQSFTTDEKYCPKDGTELKLKQ